MAERQNFYTIHGYADAKPSESIQPHEDPGIVVAALFIVTPDGGPVRPPVGQFKRGLRKNKATRARLMNDWLEEEHSKGLQMAGFCNTHHQTEAALMGLSLIEELPDTRVEQHYGKYRLHFGDEYVDFAQAVALEYYLFAVHMAALRAGLRLPEGVRRLVMQMDRFPAASARSGAPGTPLPKTDGFRFLEFVEEFSPSSIGIREEDKEAGMTLTLSTLDWWKPKPEEAWRRGKSYPNFVLPDWLAAAAMATGFPERYEELHGPAMTVEMTSLHEQFKQFDVWSMEKSASHIVGAAQEWAIPDDARQFILDRAEGNG